MKKRSFIFLFFISSNLVFAQSSEVVKNYIAAYKNIAIEEMHRTGVPAAITIAQGIHETSAGQSVLVKKSNNHFGIKCKGEWKGASVSHDDDARGECFRKYDDPLESYRDHSDFLATRAHYASLFKLDPTDYEGWCYGLKKAGYATNPKYAHILIKLINDYNLQDYTLLAMQGKPNNKVILVASNQAATEPSESNSSEEKPSRQIEDYPSGVFEINETDVVFIKKGTSYLKIAEENDISISRLFDFNDLRALDIAGYDQLLFLQRKRKTGANEFHTVADGETLHDIAQKEGIRMESLLRYNLVENGMQIKAGEKLFLQTTAGVAPQLVLTNPKPQQRAVKPVAPTTLQTILHTVQPKETVYAIAKKYEVAINDLMNWNNLQTIALKTGQQLRINKKAMNATN